MSRWRGRLLVLVAGSVLAAIVLLALFADRVAPAGPNDQDIAARLRPPAMVGGTWSRPLGTDELGRDVLSRMLHGGRVSLMVGLLAVAVSCPIGVVIGLASGFFGGWIDRMLMRFTDIQLAIPTILLAMALVTVLGPGVPNLIITLSVTGWTIYARLIRGETLALRDRDFIEATRAAGAGQARIMFRHVLPNVVSPLIVVATFAVGSMVVLEATLSFLGIGVPLRVATWGSMLSSGRTYLKSAWWITAFPGLAIFVTVLAINALGDSMRDALDPRLRSRV
ncbi:MAG TPA: ABC transporter permease [Patescibacteria group bacterium]|nr:ABC transporter permease [Patescibacteria group bacterium]